METPGFYNTINASGYSLNKENKKASNQEEIILSFFRDNAGKVFTPFEVQRSCNLLCVPVTSIRRAITNLTISGKLIKTNIQKNGQFGKPNYTWKLAIKEPIQIDLF